MKSSNVTFGPFEQSWVAPQEQLSDAVKKLKVTSIAVLPVDGDPEMGERLATLLQQETALRYAKRLGYEEAAEKIQDLYLDGKKMEAMAAVPDSLVDEVALLGPRERIRDRLAAWKSSPVGTICVGAGQVETLRTLAELVL